MCMTVLAANRRPATGRLALQAIRDHEDSAQSLWQKTRSIGQTLAIKETTRLAVGVGLEMLSPAGLAIF